MPKYRKDVGPLLDRGVDSLILAVEIFNRPSNVGREHAVLILLHHSFEMVLKAAIRQKTGRIQKPGERFTYGFDKCLSVAADEVGILDANDRVALSILDAHRDMAVHYYQEMSEDLLYVATQGAVTLFARLLEKVFKISLSSRMPSRVLPISAQPPKDLALLVDGELSLVDDILGGGSRQGARAAARLRPILALATASRDGAQRVTQAEVDNVVRRRRRGEAWEVILPEVAQLKLTTEGGGIPVSLKISKTAEAAIRIAQPGEPVVGALVKQEINIWDKFNLGRDDLAKKLGVSGPKTSALVLELGLESDPECFRVLTRKSSEFKGYSLKALELLRAAVKTHDIEAVWRKHRHRFGAGPRKK